MPEVGMEGQLKLKQAKVLLVGTGGLGAPLGLYLAAAGVGRIGLVDFDVVDFTNLQRQVIHGTKDVGRKKLDSAADRMHDINPFVQIDRHEVALTSENALDILKDYDIIVDGTDNFPTRYLVNDACVLLGKPNVYGSIFRFEGQATVFAYEGGPCYRCLYPEPPPPGLVPSCAEGGVLGILPGTDRPDSGDRGGETDPRHRRASGRPAAAVRRSRHAIPRVEAAPECRVPGVRRPSAPSRNSSITSSSAVCRSRRRNQLAASGEIDPMEVKAKIDRGDDFVLIDVREPHEYQICNIPQARLIPLGDVPKRVERIELRRRDRRALQERRAQRQGCRLPAPGRLQARPEHEGRHSGLERQGRPQRSEVLRAPLLGSEGLQGIQPEARTAGIWLTAVK